MTTTDTKADFAPNFDVNREDTRARQAKSTAAQNALTIRAPLARNSDAKVAESTVNPSPRKASRTPRAALEALDRLAQNVPVLEDARGKFVRLRSDELFGPGKASLSPLAGFTLDSIARALRAQDESQITVQVYTDSFGSIDEAVALSLRRAKAVRRYLVQLGVPADRLIAEGFGPVNPIADDGTAEGRSQNRRVEIVIGD